MWSGSQNIGELFSGVCLASFFSDPNKSVARCQNSVDSRRMQPLIDRIGYGRCIAEKIAQTHKLLKGIVLGPKDFHQQCAVGMRDPQSEVAVWLHGLGAPRDVTYSHLMASGAPFTIGIGMDGGQGWSGSDRGPLSLQFYQRSGEQRLLGKIGLRFSSLIAVGAQALYLFEIRDYRNYCLPKPRLWAHYLHYAYQRSRAHSSDVPITTSEVHAMIVFYICPRRVVLVSAADGDIGNIFPMNLMGPIRDGYFGFALNSTTPVRSLVERAGSVALSSIPLEQTSLAYSFGKNHRKEWVDFNQLPFPTVRSTQLALPVPQFSLRVREMRVEATREIGSHTLFVARTMNDEHWGDGAESFMVHGIYQAWRQKMQL